MKQNGFYVKKFFNIKRQAMLAVKFGKNGKLVEKAFQLFKQVAIKKVAAQEGIAYAVFSASIKKHSKKSKDDGKPKIPEEY